LFRILVLISFGAALMPIVLARRPVLVLRRVKSFGRATKVAKEPPRGSVAAETLPTLLQPFSALLRSESDLSSQESFFWLKEPELAYLLKPSPTPALIIGLVAPIGVDLETVVDTLTELLRETSYRASLFRVTSRMREVPTGLSISSDPYVLSYKSRTAYANAFCARLGEDALAAMAISAIRAARPDIWKSQYERGLPQLPPEAFVEETPVPSQAYIIRQLKRPEEVRLLRSVYGRQFILV
jgi:hypothetical protein